MTVFPLDQAIHDEVMRELASAKTKYGPYHFEVLCIEGSLDETIDDRQALALLRSLNRTGSMYAEVICQVE